MIIKVSYRMFQFLKNQDKYTIHLNERINKGDTIKFRWCRTIQKFEVQKCRGIYSGEEMYYSVELVR